MDKKAITLQQLEEALRDLTRWIKDKLTGYIAEPSVDGKSGYVLTNNGAGGRSWEPGGSVKPDESLSQAGIPADAAAVGTAVAGAMDAAAQAQSAAERAQETAEGAQETAEASVPRSKLATDALYSPIESATSKSITVADIGKTIRTNWNAAATYELSQENSSQIPVGAEIAILYWGNTVNGVDVLVHASDNIKLVVSGESAVFKNGSVKISQPFGMIALKKIATNNTDGDEWFITGNVEVVS